MSVRFLSAPSLYSTLARCSITSFDVAFISVIVSAASIRSLYLFLYVKRGNIMLEYDNFKLLTQQ